MTHPYHLARAERRKTTKGRQPAKSRAAPTEWPTMAELRALQAEIDEAIQAYCDWRGWPVPQLCDDFVPEYGVHAQGLRGYREYCREWRERLFNLEAIG